MSNNIHFHSIYQPLLPRIAIVGCGFGGLAAAQSLAGKGFQVVVFDKNNYHTFNHYSIK
jgi:2-polyprenyl-6-methoxyphenol hydroxylase-like FAD-dependent oxidoreductase